MNKQEYQTYLGDRAHHLNSKAEYKNVLEHPLLIEVEGKPRLTKEGVEVCEYGTEMSFLQPELDDKQQFSVIFQHFPQDLRDKQKETLTEAIEYYHASSWMTDEEMGEAY